jgi:hypothetical protein
VGGGRSSSSIWVVNSHFSSLLIHIPYTVISRWRDSLPAREHVFKNAEESSVEFAIQHVVVLSVSVQAHKCIKRRST